MVSERVQIGRIEVDASILNEPGRPLAELLAAFGASAASVDNLEQVPATGWRVLAETESMVVLGAPEAGGSGWQLAQITKTAAGSSPTEARVHLSPEPFPVRPGREARAAGLVLRWPAISRSEADPRRLAVDVVNEGASRWVPDGDAFQAIGFVSRPGEPSAGGFFGFVGGVPSAFALDPGEYVRVGVSIDAGQWRGLVPGAYDVHATLVDLPVRTGEPLRIDVTADQLDALRPKERMPPPPSHGDHRAMLEHRIRMIEALTAAHDDLAAVVQILTTARSDEDARRTLATRLGCTEEAVDAVFSAQLRRFRGGVADSPHARELAALRRDLERLPRS